MSSNIELVAKLDSLSCIHLSGPQAQEYLQGQITVDATRMDATSARFGAHCDFKGKTWSTFIATFINETYSLIMPSSILEKSLSELKKYGVFSKVDIRADDDRLAFYGLAGEKTLKLAEPLFNTLTDLHLKVHESEFGFAICINITKPRYLLVLNRDGQHMLGDLVKIDDIQGDNEWQVLNINDGLPFIEDSTSNEFVPQMLNLQALAGIDFDKGCYMGQETIARTKFLGRNKRATFILSSNITDTTGVPHSGMLLEKKVGENWRSGGTLLQVAKSDDKITALAVLSNDTEIDDVLRLKSQTEQHFIVMCLPYLLDEK